MAKSKTLRREVISSYTAGTQPTTSDELSPLSATLQLKQILSESGVTNFKTNPTPELRTFPIRLGWIQGVLIPCLLNIWGVVLFLRIAWVVAQAGIALTITIIMLSGCVCIITALSLSAICTNGEVKGESFDSDLTAILNYLLGACIGPNNDEQRAKGFVGLSWPQGNRNWASDYRYSEGRHHDYFSVFAVYFPAVTGVQAGANICGDLRNPARAIPKGTLSALGISITSYMLMALMCGFGALRDASGNTTNLSPEALEECKPNCKYGLHNNYQIMQMMAASGALVYAGCWAATLSTALTNLLSVPRLIQALGKDNIYPGLGFFSKPYGRHGEPYRGYVLTFTVSLLFLLIADLNAIAPLITNFYLASYALINFCTFHACIIGHHTWRPTYRYFNAWLSLLGFVMCLVIMIIIGWEMTLVTYIIFFILYFLVHYRKPSVAWGSSVEAQRYTETVGFLLFMSVLPDTVKSYNPQLLVLAGPPDQNPALLETANSITKFGSFMIVADIVKNELTDVERKLRLAIGKSYLIEHKLRGFYVVLDGLEFEEAVKVLLKTAGIGRLTPNVVLIGYKSGWNTAPQEQITNYFRILQLVSQKGLAISVYRPQGDVKILRNNKNSIRLEKHEDDTKPEQVQASGVMNIDSNFDISTPSPDQGHDTETGLTNEIVDTDKQGIQSTKSNVSVATTESKSVSGIFAGAKLKFLDLWWLYEDSGLNILLSYIIAERGFKFKLALRVCALAKVNQDIQESEKQIKVLLDNFRIKYTSLTIFTGLDEDPSLESWTLFNGLIQNFKNQNSGLTEEELSKFEQKTRRNLKLRENLLEYSSTASFIVMTLPMPRKDEVPAALYMTWMEVLSQSLPSTLFIRGNTKTVLAT